MVSSDAAAWRQTHLTCRPLRSTRKSASSWKWRKYPSRVRARAVHGSAVRQVLAHEPFRRCRNVAADIAKVDSDQAIEVTRDVAYFLKLRNRRVADQDEPADPIPVLHTAEAIPSEERVRATNLRFCSTWRFPRRWVHKTNGPVVFQNQDWRTVPP